MFYGGVIILTLTRWQIGQTISSLVESIPSYCHCYFMNWYANFCFIQLSLVTTSGQSTVSGQWSKVTERRTCQSMRLIMPVWMRRKNKHCVSLLINNEMCNFSFWLQLTNMMNKFYYVWCFFFILETINMLSWCTMTEKSPPPQKKNTHTHKKRRTETNKQRQNKYIGFRAPLQ